MRVFLLSLVLSTSMLLVACGPDGGVALDGGDTSLKFTASRSTAVEGDSVILNWIGDGFSSCVASGAWSGSKNQTDTESVILATAGNHLFVLRCEPKNAALSAVVKSVLVLVTTIPLVDDKQSGRNSEDAQALFNHYNQYTN